MRVASSLTMPPNSAVDRNAECTHLRQARDPRHRRRRALPRPRAELVVSLLRHAPGGRILGARTRAADPRCADRQVVRLDHRPMRITILGENLSASRHQPMRRHVKRTGLSSSAQRTCWKTVVSIGRVETQCQPDDSWQWALLFRRSDRGNNWPLFSSQPTATTASMTYRPTRTKSLVRTDRRRPARNVRRVRGRSAMMPPDRDSTASTARATRLDARGQSPIIRRSTSAPSPQPPAPSLHSHAQHRHHQSEGRRRQNDDRREPRAPRWPARGSASA